MKLEFTRKQRTHVNVGDSALRERLDLDGEVAVVLADELEEELLGVRVVGEARIVHRVEAVSGLDILAEATSKQETKRRRARQ